MTSAVLDASAVLALIRDEPGADKVAPHIGRAAISAVNLQEVVKELLLSGLDEATIRELLGELRLDVRAHDTDAAYAAAALHVQTREVGHGLGDRSCLALAMQLGIPALTADREWKKVRVRNLKVEHIR
ncbi:MULTISPECIES: type II toxin-antitoxin system VapC family toxin [unclassified Sphingomonas]|uniref:type II toxin-antitoxin system VapC family toxin n=1 Tax=unclassified Sphingomonas TaxID=196159 RepID=UPI0006FAD533|nr:MULTISPECIES: type II toxin-antitoxin system VapC family toxin [unclassified Sphingomonas]KQM63589.1 twitching motility protein PilT [Sphingomonas sp. Leaf16]KQN15205.1 twitching motility protein PilT [Sphingomonas sp. Leaf29]KQN20739.1 twitching motility protein PilT [Sphingomonas sp. Leaf32]